MITIEGRPVKQTKNKREPKIDPWLIPELITFSF